MKKRPTITCIEIIEYETEISDLGREPTIGIPMYKRGATLQMRFRGILIHTDLGITGEYFGGVGADYAAIAEMAPYLIGRKALEREQIYQDLKHALRQQARMGTGLIDIALWDLAGKYHESTVYELLGGNRKKLRCYASTYVGDHEEDGLSSPEAYADFAQACLEMGYPAFKIHGWKDSPIEEQVALVRAVGRRVGGKMDLMLDPFCTIRTFGEALKLGRACDEYGFFWYEDPFQDGGVSAHAHRKLRQLIRTPLLQLEHLRGLESHVDFIVAEATDFVRGDPVYDGGITGVLKIAHAAEGFGLDLELHGAGPDRRHLMAAHAKHQLLRNGTASSPLSTLPHPALPGRLRRPDGGHRPARMCRSAPRPRSGRGVRLGLHRTPHYRSHRVQVTALDRAVRRHGYASRRPPQVR